MKTLILAAILLSALGAVAQTDIVVNSTAGPYYGLPQVSTALGVYTTNHVHIGTNSIEGVVMVIPTPVSDNAKPGDKFAMDSTRTLVPISDKIQGWFTTIIAVLGALSVGLNALLTWWNSQGKAIQGLLVRHIEKLPDTSIQDRIKVDAESKGLETALSKVVEANTISAGPVPTPGPFGTEPKPVEPPKP